MKRRYNQGLFQNRHKGSLSTLCSKGNKEKYEYCDLKSHSKDFCWKKYLNQALSWWNKDGPGKLGSKNYSRKDGITFNFAAIIGEYNYKTASHAFSSWIKKMGIKWNINTGCSEHMCNNRLYFSSYKAIHQSMTI